MTTDKSVRVDSGRVGVWSAYTGSLVSNRLYTAVDKVHLTRAHSAMSPSYFPGPIAESSFRNSGFVGLNGEKHLKADVQEAYMEQKDR